MILKEANCFPGLKVGQLTLIHKVRIKSPNARYSRGGWYCKCDCGNTVSVRIDSLGDRIISCGCYNKEHCQASATNKLHQKYSTSDSQSNSKYHKLYDKWEKIRKRCLNPKDPEYNSYGGRGITICKEWLDYANFKGWALSTGYDYRLNRSQQSIGRIDVNKGYSPDNCRWADMFVQANNKTDTIYVDFKGKKTTLGNLARKYHVGYQTIIRRYKINHNRDEDLVRSPYAPRKYN